MSLYANIALLTPIRVPFTYSIPTDLASQIQVGMRVYVPFNARYTIGVVQSIHDEVPSFKTKSIKSILDHKPILSKELVQLADWMHRYYYCSFGEVMQAMLPSGLNYQSVKMVKVLNELSQEYSSEIKSFLDFIKEKGSLPLADALAPFKEIPASVLVELEQEKVIECWEEPKVKSKQATELVWNWVDETSQEKAFEELQKSPKRLKWHVALEVLLGANLPATTSELNALHCSTSSLSKIVSLDLLKKEERIKSYSDEFYSFNPSELRALNEEQFKAYEQIKPSLLDSIYKVFLLKGITGSGKTEVYIHALKTCIEEQKGAIILVPEIALTPQTVRRFFEIFGDSIAVLHSRLTDSERLFAWNELKQGRKKIAIGPRSALFAPVQHLGLIIVDEEHDNSYKQEDPAPRYQGRDAAIMRAYLEKIPIVLGSATPSLTTWSQVQDGKYELLELKSRHAGALLPDVELLDLTKYKKAMKGPLTVQLYLAIQSALEKQEQVILLLNRRGYAPYLLCTSCGSIQECPNCSVSLTYHKPSKAFRCHYCGYGRYEKSACTSCGHHEMQLMGTGTQKIEEEIITLFPEARILRMDQDTTRGKHAHRDITEAFRKQEYDLLIGTQLVSKGLDFPNVTVVGVINTDTELAFPSYKAHERMFQLMSQVAGRSGRGKKKGVVYLQSWKPQKLALEAAKNHNYEQFAQAELAERKELEYPPFSKIIAFTFKGKTKEDVGNAALCFADALKEHAPKWPILGPSPSTIEKIDREYYWELFLKMHPEMKTHGIEGLLNRIVATYDSLRKTQFSAVRIIVRVDY